MSIESRHRLFTPQHSDFLGKIVPFSTTTLTLDEDMNGMLLRSDGNSAVTITVPSGLPLGFNVGFAMFGTGAVTLSAAGGVSNRSGKTQLLAQYQSGSLFVAKTNEFIVGGDFV